MFRITIATRDSKWRKQGYLWAMVGEILKKTSDVKDYLRHKQLDPANESQNNFDFAVSNLGESV